MLFINGLNNMNINAKVVDIYHGDNVSSFKEAYVSGIRGIIHKATQGVLTHDPLYAARRALAKSVNMLWGAYDFNTGDNPKQQVEYFFKVAQPDETTLCALDLEDNTHSEMSLTQAREYLEYGDEKLGRTFWLYSGNRIKQLIVHADSETKAFFAKHKLWGCEYGPKWKNFDVNGQRLPWDKPTLWQYTDGKLGLTPHGVPGLQSHMDVNHFDGTDEELAAIWIS